MRIHRFLLCLFLFVSAIVLSACANDDDDDVGSEYFDPAQRGPYPVGNITRVYVDTDRPETLEELPGSDRTLVTEIWYPASVDSAGEETDGFVGFLGETADFIGPLLATELGGTDEDVERVMSIRTGSVRDAAISNDGPFPVILFSHGNSGVRFQSMSITEYLASHGYIVVSPDHTGNAAITILPDNRLVMYDGATFTYDDPVALEGQLDTRVGDFSFLLDVLELLNLEDPDGRFIGKIDTERVGMTGHSYGGMTTLHASATEPRIDAGAPMAGPSPIFGGTDIPMMHFIALNDETVELDGNDLIRDNFGDSDGPRWILEIEDAGHFSFSDMCLLNSRFGDGCGEGERLENGETFTYLSDKIVHQITNFYQTAFFGYYLKGIEAYAGDLQSNGDEENLELEFDRFP